MEQKPVADNNNKIQASNNNEHTTDTKNDEHDEQQYLNLIQNILDKGNNNNINTIQYNE